MNIDKPKEKKVTGTDPVEVECLDAVVCIN